MSLTFPRQQIFTEKVAFPNIWASLVAQTSKNLPACMIPEFNPWVGKISWRRNRLPTLVFLPSVLRRANFLVVT